MKTVEIVKIALKAIGVNKVRSALTMLGVIIGVASVVLLVSIGNGLKTYITDQFEGLGSNLIIAVPGKMSLSKGGDPSANFTNSKFTQKEVDNIKRDVPNVVSASAASRSTKWASHRGNGSFVTVNGTDENFKKVRNRNAEKGRFFTKGEVRGYTAVAVIGKTVAKNLFNERDPINKTILLEDKKFTVIGLYEKKGGIGGRDQDNEVLIPYTVAKRDLKMDKISSISIKIDKGTNIDLARKDVEKAIRKTLNKDDFTVLTQQELLSSISSILNTLTVALGGIAAVSLLVGGIGIMNIMLVSVAERTREIGLRKALGATPNDLLYQFMAEAVILSAFGGILGIAISSLASSIAGKFIATKTTIWSVALAFAFSILVGIIFGTYPAYKAAKKNPIDALRYE